MNTGKIAKDDRELIIKLYKNGVHPAAISDSTGVSLSSVYRLINEHKAEAANKADNAALNRIAVSISRIEELLDEINRILK